MEKDGKKKKGGKIEWKGELRKWEERGSEGEAEGNKNVKKWENKLSVHYSVLVQHFAVRGFHLRAFEVSLCLSQYVTSGNVHSLGYFP